MKRALALVIIVVAGCGTAGPVATQTAAPTRAPTAVASTAPATPAAQASLPPGVLGGGTTWDATAGQFGTQQGNRFLFQCPPGGSAASVWGTDTYTADSSVCTAAVHAGLIDFASGGPVVIEIRPGQESYAGSERNGVTSRDYGNWGASFAFVDASQPPPTATTGATATPTAGTAEGAYQALLTHIPAVIRNTCTEIDPSAAGTLAVANCRPEDVIIDPDVVVDDVVYVWFDTLLGATQRYAQVLQEVGDQFGDDCAIGPSQVAYEIDGVVHGRLLCAPDNKYGGEVVAWWYDDRLNLVGSVLLAEGSYEDLFNVVMAAAAQP